MRKCQWAINYIDVSWKKIYTFCIPYQCTLSNRTLREMSTLTNHHCKRCICVIGESFLWKIVEKLKRQC